MADFYATQQAGVADGTNPPARADGRQVGAKRRVTLASKSTTQAVAVGDRMFLGFLAPNEKLVGVKLTTDTSLATTTVSVGDGTTADRWVAAKTLTVTDVPTILGPKATTLAAAPAGARLAIWATFGVAAVAAAVNLTFELEIAGVG